MVWEDDMNTQTQKASNEVLSVSQRWLEASFDVPMLLLFGFFAYHQVTQTGFFTAQFGPVEMICLYGPILISLVAPVVRALTGRRNPARPFDVATYLSLALGSLWLLIVFPFDFSHLADVLPGAIRFVIAWISNDVGRIIMALQVFLGPVSSAMTIWRYISIRRRTSIITPAQPVP
jgi:hypothetical protein